MNTTMSSTDSFDFDPIIPGDERRFYQKAYPNVNFVRERKVHCTVCKMHIGTAPSNESIIRMHPILRVTHCKKCHEFYNSGEFSKGEDGSELYCRWCGQGGEVYCCSNCPYVFCKSCIISNLSRGVVADIEQNENWSCFNCAPKMLWPLRAQHWALMKFIDKQKKAILNSNLSDSELRNQMTKDRSLCCKVKKTSGYGSDSSDTSDISLSQLKQKAGEKRNRKSLSKEDLTGAVSPAISKKSKNNDEVVCTPDVMSFLEPECQLTMATNSKPTVQPLTSTPKVMSIPQPQKQITPPPLMFRSPQVSQVPLLPQIPQIPLTPSTPQLRPAAPTPVVKKTIVGPRLPASTAADFSTPVYHTINGYRIDLNSAAQQETVRLPNGKLIQVKRQGTGPQTATTAQNTPNQQSPPPRIIHAPVAPTIPPVANVPSQQIVHSSGGHVIRTNVLPGPRSITVQNPSIIPQYQQHTPQQAPPHVPPQAPQQYQQITIRQPNQQIATIRYQGAPNQQVTNMLQNGTMQLLNGAAVTTTGGQVAAVRQMPSFVKQFFPNTHLGQSRSQLQNQIFSAVDICQHLMGKAQTLTNSNAYKTAKSMTDVKELYIHLSYLLTYAIGRFKGLQDSCLADMRELGFTTDANSLENGQLAAGTDMVRSGKIKDFANVDLDSFHALIVQNMDLMKTAAADSSTNADGIDLQVEDKLERMKYDESTAEANGYEYDENENEFENYSNDTMNDEKSKTDIEYDYYENFTSPVVELIEDDEDEGKLDEDQDDCLLVESSPAYDISDVESDGDDCLLVECGERDFDGEVDEPPPMQQLPSEDEEDDVELKEKSKFSTMYENDDDYCAPAACAFTPELDILLIKTMKATPELWDPTEQRSNSAVQIELWKNIIKRMPSGLDCRMRWRRMRYKYMRYMKRLAMNPSVKHNQPPEYAHLLTFLDDICNRLNGQDVPKKSDEKSIKKLKSGPSLNRTATDELRDDHDFIVKMIGAIKRHSSLWDKKSPEYNRHTAQPEVWQKVHTILKNEGHKQASDAEEDEISIVEPKTDTINLDSDNEDELPPPPSRPNGNTTQPPLVRIAPKPVAPTHVIPAERVNVNLNTNMNINLNTNENLNTNVNVNTNANANMNMNIHINTSVNTNSSLNSCNNQTPIISPPVDTVPQDDLNAEYDFSKVANLLASMLEVELTENGSEAIQLPKKPRKKTTNKPNPTLVKQKEMQQRERLENMKKNDAKLKMQVQIPLNKVEEIYEYAKPLVDELKLEKEEKLDIAINKIESLSKIDEEICENKKEEKKDQVKEPDESKVMVVEDDTKKDTAAVNTCSGSKVDDKDDTEEVVVVLVEDADNSKEDEDNNDNETEENGETIEIIEQDESQESDTEIILPEDSIGLKDLIAKGKNKEKEVGEGLKEDLKAALKEALTDEKPNETETDDVFEEDDEVVDSEVQIDFGKANNESLQSAKKLDHEKEDGADVLMDEDSDPLLVPLECDASPVNDIATKAADELITSMENSPSSHNIDFQSILGRTEVA